MNKQRGFTLVEIFISLAVGLALFAGVLSVFVGMKTTSQETATYGELQENGRFALSVLSDDLLKQNFWGDYTGTLDKSMLNAVPNSAPSDECIGEGLNNGTFPAGIGHFRALWGQTVTNSSIMGCIEDAKVASDVIQFKRAISEPLTLSTAQQYYIISNLSEASIFTGTTIPKVLNSQLWEYQHHIYYIREEVQGNNTVPVLMQGRLTKKMTFDPIIDGIEMIRFMYGLDTDSPDNAGYGIVDTFVSADNMTITQWDHGNDNRILAVRIYVLARSILPDSKYTNSNTYNLGDLPVTFNDNYRRLLFNSTVTLYNAGVDSW
ncbi:prepilin-type cleavage/methylation domain-containing protein [Colwellia sp. M166]|uniref:PilW family protein n=1 Tax=Colwellia sp. M166 TaxID=2583805 RepID=UPI00211EBE0A|nr:PilW family protein [Colwellia sp. M166]UUO22523.1 prepilin-type cleavage/methylation domain-containing protein [Colwellia sp. M166]|tara:strand:- start:14361 stop:15320 length:960 start_codon:yes stop_codon:yes gene_type:complete